jgi:hypothetical protein
MRTRVLMVLSAGIEMATGVALIAAPGFVGRALFRADLPAAGMAVARLAGLGLLSLGVACWPGANEPTRQATRALFIYNLLAALYLGYLRGRSRVCQLSHVAGVCAPCFADDFARYSA